jgi:hypothetical protein
MIPVHSPILVFWKLIFSQLVQAGAVNVTMEGIEAR